MSALDAALDIWQDVQINQVRQKSMHLGDLLIALIEQQASLKEFSLRSPQNKEQRGSQVAFAHPHAYAICQALIANKVIADFRAPNILRFGLTPLYLSYQDIAQAVAILREVVESKAYTQACYNQAQKVT
jgi:kynureninase